MRSTIKKFLSAWGVILFFGLLLLLVWWWYAGQLNKLEQKRLKLLNANGQSLYILNTLKPIV